MKKSFLFKDEVQEPVEQPDSVSKPGPYLYMVRITPYWSSITIGESQNAWRKPAVFGRVRSVYNYSQLTFLKRLPCDVFSGKGKPRTAIWLAWLAKWLYLSANYVA
jgi:hypothetical protein